MKNVLIYLIALFSFLHSGVFGQANNKWTYLFDGKSVDKLRGYKMTSFPAEAWKVEEGALVAQTGVPNIDLVTKESYKNFELALDWKVSVAGNSGVFFI